MDTETLVELRAVAGPDAGGSVVVGVGRHVLGRARTAALRFDDPALEPHHLAVRVDARGRVHVRQLAGRAPVLVDGAAIGSGEAAVEGTVVVGATRLELATPTPTPSSTAGSGAFVRPVRRRLPVCDPPIEVPASEREPASPPAAFLVGALATVAGAATVALVIGQPLVVVMGLAGAVTSVGTWAVGRWRHRRAVRGVRAANEAALAGLEQVLADRQHTVRAHHLAVAPSLVSALRAVGRPEMWQRRRDHGDALQVAIGFGAVRRPVQLRGEVPPRVVAAAARTELLAEVPVVVDLARHRVVGVAGAGADAVVRGLLVQLAALTGPADWRLEVATATPVGWAEDLPHRVGSAAEAPDGTHLVVLIDRPALLAAADAPLRRLLDRRADTTVIVVAAAADELGATCTATLTAGAGGSWHWHDTTLEWADAVVHAAGATVDRATCVAAVLACWTDPEVVGAGGPPDRAMAELPGVPAADPSSIAATWCATDARSSLEVPIGIGHDGPVGVDLVAAGPHALVAGTTGSGKSELLRTLVLGLASRHGPDALAIALVDFKGGATFDGLAELPHVAGSVTDLDHGGAARLLASLDAEIVHRERVLRSVGAPDLVSCPAGVELPRLVVVVDELAALLDRHPGAAGSLAGIAQRGRSLGVHLVLATQRPAGVVGEAVRANVSARIALRVESVADALDVVGDPAPALVPVSARGRAWLRAGPGAPTAVSVARSLDARRRVDAILSAAAGTRARPVCLPPLPDRLSIDDPRVVGRIDDLVAQAQPPLEWSLAANLALVGSGRAGTTSALLRVLGSVPDDHERLVVVGAHERRFATVDAPVVVAHDLERMDRVVRRLAEQCDTRVGPRVVVAIDDLGLVRRILEGAPDPTVLARLDRVLADGPPAGVVTVASVRPVGVRSVAAWFGERWVFHLDDAADGPALGVSAAQVPPRVPGRVVVAGSGRSAQVALARDEPTDGSGRRHEVPVLPERVGRWGLGVPSRGRGAVRVPVGIEHRSLAPLLADIAPEEHWLVLGPPRSGRSSALALVAHGWADVHGWGSVVAIVGRPGSPLGDLPAPVPLTDARDALAVAGRDDLVVVDDAERVALTTTEVAALTARGAVLVAACRPAALRGAYDHWLHSVRRSGTGLVMAGSPLGTGDLLDAEVPRHLPVRVRPGLAWMVAGGGATLVQLADPTTSDLRETRPMRSCGSAR
ncbi:MAG: hypothetical protein MUE78_00300 [Ilumatobacteraceae bacterium]|nr:hypothetical protein [Ilumatobacteraceae bacterium]